MVSVAPLTSVHGQSHHRNKPAKKSCALATVLELALHVNSNGRPFAVEEKVVNYKQFGFATSALSGCKNISCDSRSPKRDKGRMMTATENG